MLRPSTSKRNHHPVYIPMPFPKHIKSHKTGLHFLKHTLRISQRWWNTAFSVNNTKNLVPNTFMRSLPRTKAAAYKHSLKFTLTESWHKSNIEFCQYNIMYCHCHESMCEKRLILYEIAKTNKISTWRSALRNWEQQNFILKFNPHIT
jgi:hypothetical protein